MEVAVSASHSQDIYVSVTGGSMCVLRKKADMEVEDNTEGWQTYWSAGEHAQKCFSICSYICAVWYQYHN